jgi:alkaline phosphatase D
LEPVAARRFSITGRFGAVSGKYGIYRSYRWGQAMELFILDARSHRDPKKGTMLGKVQKEWLFEGIASSNALFKFIASAVPMAGGGSDRWDGYPKERTAMLRYINEKKIRGVVFLSADLHYAAITKIPKGRLRDITTRTARRAIKSRD